MELKHSFSQEGTVSEMSIVDTFTQLIFEEVSHFNEMELMIVSAVRAARPNLSLDDPGEMGVYLRALGVSEMITLVSEVQLQIASGHSHLAGPVEFGADFHQRVEI